MADPPEVSLARMETLLNSVAMDVRGIRKDMADHAEEHKKLAAEDARRDVDLEGLRGRLQTRTVVGGGGLIGTALAALAALFSGGSKGG